MEDSKIIIQLGCFRFIDKHIEHFINDNNRVILVDANRDALNEIPKNKLITKLNFAITEKLEITDFYKTKSGVSHDYVASLHLSHLQKHGENNPFTDKVIGINFENLLKLLCIDKVDILYMDIEGNDHLVLKEILEKNLNVISIVYESNHMINNFIDDYLLKGYSHTIIDQWNSSFHKTKEPPIFIPS